MASYLFYDIETTGLNPAFDQILQFAAIRTDMTLKEIDRHVLAVRLRPDVIPSPQAVLTHGISMDDSLSGCCEFEGITQIHRWLNEPGTISLGYNSLNFDDEFLRFAFYRNLLPPYTHQYDKGCLRMDLFPMVIAFRLYRPDVLQWPEVDGKSSLKLEHINAANRLAEGRSHDAISDTKAAWALARRLMGEPDMWNYLSGYFHKTTDLLRIDKLPAVFESPAGTHRKGLMISSEFGPGCFYQAPVLSIGKSVPYRNQTLWLRLDLPELKGATPDTISETTWVVRKKIGEPGFLLPPLDRYWNQLKAERRETVRENIQWLQSNPALFQEIIQYHRDYRYPIVPDLDADAALYQIGFLSPEEQNLCRRFHQASFEERTRMINRFPGTELREVATRILLRNYQSQLTGKLLKIFSTFMERVNPRTEDAAMVDYRGNRRTTPLKALAEIRRLKQTAGLDPNQVKLLDALAGYITERFQAQIPPA